MFKYGDELIAQLLEAIFNGEIDETDLPTGLYFAIADYLKQALYKGFGINFTSLGRKIERRTVQYTEKDLDLLTELRQNIYMFSAAKTFQQVFDMTNALTTDDGVVKTFGDFKTDARAIFDQYNEDWLKSEYITAVTQGQSAIKWDVIEDQKDVLPYITYNTIGDACEICAPLDGITAEVDDPIWDTIMPANHFNCRCAVTQTDDKNKLTPDGKKTDIVDGVTGKMNDVFLMNPGKEGYVFRPDHPYFTVPKGYGKFKEGNFGLQIPDKDGY